MTPTDEQIEAAAQPDPEARKEMDRIKALFSLDEGDGEDLITYSKEVAKLRQAKSADPFAYEFEVWLSNPHGGGWCPELEYVDPREEGAWKDKSHLLRNVRPLYTAPPASDVADVVEECERVISAWALANDINGADRNDLLKRIRELKDNPKPQEQET